MKAIKYMNLLIFVDYKEWKNWDQNRGEDGGAKRKKGEFFK